jgi:hypothetical protein
MNFKATAYDTDGNEIKCDTCGQDPQMILQGSEGIHKVCDHLPRSEEPFRIPYDPNTESTPVKILSDAWRVKWDDDKKEWVKKDMNSSQ